MRLEARQVDLRRQVVGQREVQPLARGVAADIGADQQRIDAAALVIGRQVVKQLEASLLVNAGLAQHRLAVDLQRDFAQQLVVGGGIELERQP